MYIIMAQPLKRNIPPFVLSIFGTDNKFKSNHVLSRWDFVKTELSRYKTQYILEVKLGLKNYRFSFSIRFGIEVVGISSDGDARLLRCMKLNSHLGQEHPESMPPYFNCSITKTSYIQDTPHIGTKVRNKLLQPSSLIPMGTKLVSNSHLKILIKKRPKDEHGLVLKDICPEDRQNFDSLIKTTEPRVLQCLKQHVTGSEGTVMYLELCRKITSAFLDNTLIPTERVSRIWYCIFFLRIWRSWIFENGTNAKKSATNEYTVCDSFISPNAYECIELNGHGLVQLIMKFRDEGKPEQFLPDLFSSQACESTFRQFRSLSTIYWTKINMTLLEVFQAVGRVELQNDIRFFKIPDVEFARTNNDDSSQEVFHDLPSNEVIFETVETARREAIRDAAFFGMDVPLNDTLACQLTPAVINAQNKNANPDTNEQLCDGVQHLHLSGSSKSITKSLTSIDSNLKLRDYTDQGVVLNELGPLTEVEDKNGKSKVVRKSSLIWLLDSGNSKLSSDRLRRVQSTCIENANRSMVSASPSHNAQMGNDLIWISEELNIGDWCFFVQQSKKRSARSKATIFENLRVGIVVSFKYITGKTMKEKQYPWDTAPTTTKLKPSERRGIHVLATWYTYSENGLLKVLDADKKHFYLDVKDYVATAREIRQSAAGTLEIEATQLDQFNRKLRSILDNLM